MYRIWYSSESFKDFIVENTLLKNHSIESKKIYESDGNNAKKFHSIPDHLKKILYLDCPDIIVEKDFEPVFSIEDTKEAGTGHNAFQRFARLAASAENNVPCMYIYPEAKIISRKDSNPTWDKINPLIFKTLNKLMNLYRIPSLLFYYPSDFREHVNTPESSIHKKDKGLKLSKNLNYLGCPDENDSEMKKLFKIIDCIILETENKSVLKAKDELLNNRLINNHRNWMLHEYYSKNPSDTPSSPLTNTVEIPTKYLLNYLNQYENQEYQIGELLKSRENTVIYQVDAKFRGDPYPGALASIDYHSCRTGKTFEERDKNLVLAWGVIDIDHSNQTIILNSSKRTSIKSFMDKVKNSDSRSLTSKEFGQLKNYEIPRYYMQARYGTMFTKSKEVRIYSYFADAILFCDGALWRDG
ncbi:hypothetical protein HNP87_001402 [Methanococcus maripaludis]|uniref:Uncharacterized protein n=1 Tax=Methanococcus maripaludis TaxID=39152 RepID=A0A7J9NJY1_METMI|nr:hypothetical protein [Methanococcus maripaludis]MBA2840870.1 hypothetical protein [Methanococcus maripaludis]